jgi:DNA-binding transcriptional MerR regulator
VSTVEKTLRIGELAELAGTTPRTIRYYEEIGLLGSADDRDQGKHRSYTQADLDRVKEILRLRDLLEAETARAEIRREYRQSEDPDTRRRLLGESLGHIATQLKLVRGRRRELEQLEQELVNKQREVSHKLKRLGG